MEYGIVVIVAALLGCGICCGFCCHKGGKIAIVDVQKVVSQSRPVAELRQDMQNQMAELQEWVAQSNAEIDKEKSKEKKEELTKAAQEELQQKQLVIQKAYSEKLQQLDASLTAIIEKTAKEEGFQVVLVKSSVAAGGTDITDKVIAKVSK